MTGVSLIPGRKTSSLTGCTAEPPDARIIVPCAIVVEPRLGVVLHAREEVGVPQGTLGEGDIIGGVELAIRAGAGDGGAAEAVVGVALGEEDPPEEAVGLGGERHRRAQAIGEHIHDRLPEARGIAERVAVGVRVPEEGERLVDPGAVEVGMRLAVGGSGEDPHDVFLVVEEAGDGPGHILLNAPSEAVVAVGRGQAGGGDPKELVLDVVGVGGGGQGGLVGLAGAIPVSVIGVRETVIFQQAVGRIVDVGGREVGGPAVADRVVGEDLIDQAARQGGGHCQ